MRIPVRVDVIGAVSGFERTLGRVTGVVFELLVTFGDSSSVSDSSSELDSSSEDSDSSFLAAAAAAAVDVGVVDPDWRNRL